MGDSVQRQAPRNALLLDELASPLRPVENPGLPEDLKQIAILELLANDPRPSFVIDLEDIVRNGWRTTYANEACLSALSDALVLRDDDGAGSFREWASNTSNSRQAYFQHNRKLWVSYDLRKRWRVLSGTPLEQLDESDLVDVRPDGDGTGSSSSGWLHLSTQDSVISDKTSEEPSWYDSLPSTAFVEDIFKAHDWSTSPLGPLANWSYLLRRSTRFVLADPAAACLFWGEQFCCVYNSAYSEVMGPARQASRLGQPVSVVWPEIYEKMVPLFLEVRSTRQACGWNNIQFFVERNGLLTETYWDWNLIPLMEDRGVSTGLYSSIYETTKQFLANRRQDSVFAPAHAENTISFWSQFRENCASNPWDVPFAAFYDIVRPRRLSVDSDNQDHKLPQRCILRGSIGVPDGHKAFPVTSDLSPHADGIMPYLFQAAQSRESMILSQESHPSLFGQLEGLEWAGFGIPPTTVVVFCLRLGDEILGFAMMGLNPRRVYNAEEHRFIDMLDTHLSASISVAALLERSHENEERLQRRLTQSLEQIQMSDARYRAITEMNPLGTINVTPTGETLYANRTWFEITGHQPEADYSKVSFRNVIHEDDLAFIDSEFDLMVNNKETRYYEIRLKQKKYYPELHRWDDRWILCTGGPECDEQGNVRSVIGCVTDITAQKHAEDIQARHRQAAEEAKAAQEKFMDATSHEMRNPLSAITHSAEDLLSSLNGTVPHDDENLLIRKSAVEACLDATNVIALCAQHQTRIVDDVLIMSKMESHMLKVVPAPTQPLRIVKETLRMYNSEFITNHIRVNSVVEPAYNEHQIDWVYCDPARLKQVVINMISNAVKFSRQGSDRRITVHVTASAKPPPEVNAAKVKWFPARPSIGSQHVDITEDPAWGDGDVMYIGMVVSDSGSSLTDLERSALFNRFAQANTLTHVHYGGSGLGIYIFRELTEMQGGEVGIVDESGNGGSLAFYIKCRRAVSLQQPKQSDTPLLSASPLIPEAIPGGTPPMPQVDGSIGMLPLPIPTAMPSGLGISQDSTKALDILIVEDNLVNQRVMMKQLVKAGCRVTVANHGQEALDHLLRSALYASNSGQGIHFDIALVDIEMPVMNGLDCARAIRQMQACGDLIRHVPLMAVTANARKEQIEDCFAAGMDDVTTKPFKVRDLLIKVENLVAKFVSEVALN